MKTFAGVISGGMGFLGGAALGMFAGHMIAGAILGAVVAVVAHRVYLASK